MEHLARGEMRPEIVELVANTRSLLNVVCHFGDRVALDKDITVGGRKYGRQEINGGSFATAVLEMIKRVIASMNTGPSRVNSWFFLISIRNSFTAVQLSNILVT